MAITYRGTDPDGDLTNDEMDSNFETCEQRYEGSSIASATALALTADYNYFTISGNTNISSMTDVHVGHQVTLKFDAAGGSLVHGTTILMPGSVSYTWEAGDVAIFINEASGVYRCIQYLPYRVWDTAITQSASDNSEKKATTAYADAAMTADGAWSHIATFTTNSTTLGETTAIPTGCTRIRINISALSMIAIGNMWLQISDSATYTGKTYKGGMSKDNAAEVDWTSSEATISQPLLVGDLVYGIIELEKMSASSDIWIVSSRLGEDSTYVDRAAGLIDLPGEMDRLKITASNAYDGGDAYVEAYVP